MRVKHFLSRLEHDRVHQAIRAAEEGTSGDIVVFITRKRVPDALAAAHAEFRQLRLEAAAEKNSLLIFLAPKSQTFAVVGGATLHEKVEQPWWDELVALLGRHFKAGDFTGGLATAIEHAGQELRRHFPAGAVDRAGQHDIIED